MPLLATPVALFVFPPLLIKVLWILGSIGICLVLITLLLLTTLLNKCCSFRGSNCSLSLGIMIHQHQRLQPSLRVFITAFCVIIQQIILDLVMLRVARLDKSKR